jgi:hypothetical protein
MLGVEEQSLAGLSLEDLAQRVAESDPERLDEVKTRAADAFDFRGISPNFGHEAAALLLREGAIRLISVNWDCGVERGGTEIGIQINGVVNAAESTAIAFGLSLSKVHGCASRPQTLAITQADVDEPQGWAVGTVQGALAEAVVVFVGLGTVGMYVQEPIESLVEAWTEASSVLIADPKLSERWKAALGEEKAAKAHIASDADGFLDDLLRALVLEAFENCEQDIRALAEQEDWAEKMLEGFERIREAMAEASADSVIRWWRDGVNPSVDGEPFITAQAGRWSAMTVALLAAKDGGQIEVTGLRGRQSVSSEKHYFEIFSRPDQPANRVETAGRHRIHRRYLEGVYPTPKPVSVVVAGATGKFAAPSAPIDISAGDAKASDIAEGIEALPVHFFLAEDGVHGKLPA